MTEIKCVPGSLVVYRQKPAKILAVNDGKIEISLNGGETKNVRLKDIIPLHGGPMTQLPSAALPTPDLHEAVAMMGAETLSMPDFTELVYGKSSPVEIWSAWLLLEEGIYFTGSLDEGIKARPEDEIKAELDALAAKENSRRQKEDLIERIRSGKLLPEDRQYLCDVENLALGKTPASGIMRQLNMEQTPENAHRLLLNLRLWDCFTNPHPARSGIIMDDPAMDVPALPVEERLDLTAMTALAIDDEGNQDPDDAISYADGLLWVHVADVAALIQPGDAVDKEAEGRGANLYLPERTVHMLPRQVTSLLGLGLQEKSPALSFAIRFEDSGEPTLVKVIPSLIKASRFSYEEAEEQLETEPLSSLLPLLERFRRFRERNGALRIELPEVKIRAADGNVSIKTILPLQSREIVADSMMAAGCAIGKFAIEKEIPFPFAVQPPADISGKPETMAAMFAARKSCTATLVQTTPGIHSGLGLNPYVRITSPLRRYSDLVAHQQLRLFLAGKTLLTAEDIDGKMAKSETAAADLRRIERTSNEFWKLVFLELNPSWKGHALIVERMDSRCTVLLPELAYEYKLRSAGNLEINTEWIASINAIDLPTLMARFTLSHQGPE